MPPLEAVQIRVDPWGLLQSYSKEGKTFPLAPWYGSNSPNEILDTVQDASLPVPAEVRNALPCGGIVFR